MEAELSALLGSLTNSWLRQLMDGFFNDPALKAAYRVAPAAKGMHHVYLGGLLEHSLAVAKLVDAVDSLYGGFNRDLLITGALLHDAGKIREMIYARSFDYSDEGKLIGHITIGVEMISERIAALPGFPVELGMLLKHLILSHHGQYEYGSPKRPKTIEATVLNYLDDLDSKINGIRTHIRKDGELQGGWTSFHRLYDRYFFTKNGMERSAVEPSPEPEPEAELSPRMRPQPEPGQQKQNSFHHNPFEKLKNENLDLF
jgi:3'-5' exoribonuclease